MKKLTFTLLLISFFQFIHAQEATTASDYFLGGNFSINIQNNGLPYTGIPVFASPFIYISNGTEETKHSRFVINPYIGKSLNPHWVGGILLNFQYYTYEFEQIPIINQPQTSIKRDAFQYGGGLFARYIFNPNQSFNVYIQPSIQYISLAEEEKRNSVFTQEDKANYISIDTRIGLLYNINDNFRIVLRSGGLSFVTGKWKIEDTDIEQNFSSFRTNLNLSSISFGFELML